MTIKPGHPRIWLTPERLSWLKANQGTLEWKRLLANCEDGWTRDTYNNALNYALVYQVTGSKKHAEKAIQLCELYIAMGMDAMTKVGAVSPHGFGPRIVLPEVGVTYDWLWGYLAADRRKRWADQLMAWCNWCWLETNPTKGMPPARAPDNWGQSNPGDNFYVSFLMSLIAAIAVTPDHPDAQTQIKLGMQKTAELEAYLEKYAPGGFSLEGTNYGSWLRHGWLWAALTTATDYQSALWPRFLKDAIACRPQVTCPNRKSLVPLGGQPGLVAGMAPMTEDHAGIALVGMTHGDAATQALSKAWYDGMTFGKKRQNSWQAALWYDNRIKAADLKRLPLVYHAPGSGYVSMRSSWEADAVQVVFLCGPVRESHQDYAAGEFYIHSRGEWLTGPARLWGLGGEMLPSEYHNVLLVGKDAAGVPRGQPGQVGSQALPKDSMRIAEAPQTSGTMTHVSGEAGRAYDYYQAAKVWPVLEWWVRKIDWTAPGELKVTDTVRKVSAADPVIFQLQCKNPPILHGSRYTIQGDTGRLEGIAMLSSGTPLVSVRPIYKGKGAALSSYAVEVTAPGGQAEVTLTNTLEIA